MGGIVGRAYDGTGDPLDQVVDLGRDNNFGDWLPGGEQSPEEILIRCESADEEAGCKCGAHLEQYLAAHSNPSTSR